MVLNASLSTEYMLMQRHEKATQEVLRNLGVTPKVMDEFDIAALLEASGIGISKWREVVKCLKTYMQLDTICVSERMYTLHFVRRQS
jgi:predicted component of type VI protein secretion system